MNTNRKFAVGEGVKAVSSNRQAATIVASPRKIAIAVAAAGQNAQRRAATSGVRGAVVVGSAFF